jgi:hypothetical protein
MPRPKKDPSYRQHSGQAIVTLPDGPGRRRDFLLGEFNSPASLEEYRRLINLWRENDCRIRCFIVIPRQQEFVEQGEQVKVTPLGRAQDETRVRLAELGFDPRPEKERA